MNILVLSPYPERLSNLFSRYGDNAAALNEPPSADLLDSSRYNFFVSYGYPHIVPAPLIKGLDGKLINLHISLLPWNRGADPNFWSFFESTPKGITVHYMDAGIDTGDIIGQREIIIPRGATLASSYALLQSEMLKLFEDLWPRLREGRAERRSQPAGGGVHKRADIEPFRHLLTQGWETPVAEIERAGRMARKVS
ncbi:MAG: formyltransferase family protein [Gammaproteobacteria bacterium]|nr:formyltransferase family protein [Gammaproteobacteria bacterium]